VLVGGAVLSLSTAPVNANLAQFAPSAEPVAVVDLQLLIESLDERTQGQKELDELGTRLEKGVNDIRTELRARADELETASDARARQLFEEIVRLQARLQAEEQYAQRIAAERLTRLKRDLYRKVLAAVENYSTTAGYSLVISDDSAAPLPNDGGLQALEASMISRTVLYARETVDITEAVANRMNTDFKNAGGNR
jgi:Skp family chaperone for outer membrane proteins